jgi:hypothetical protein
MTKTRQKFNEEVRGRFEAMVRQLQIDIPEVDAIGIAITYSPELGEPIPQCIVMADDVTDADLLCRMGISCMKLGMTLIQGIAVEFAKARQINEGLARQADDANQKDQEGPIAGEKEPGRSSNPGSPS